MKTSYVVLVVALLSAIGVFISELPNYASAIDTVHFGKLLLSIAAVVGAWIAKSPAQPMMKDGGQ